MTAVVKFLMLLSLVVGLSRFLISVWLGLILLSCRLSVRRFGFVFGMSVSLNCVVLVSGLRLNLRLLIRLFMRVLFWLIVVLRMLRFLVRSLSVLSVRRCWLRVVSRCRLRVSWWLRVCGVFGDDCGDWFVY